MSDPVSFKQELAKILAAGNFASAVVAGVSLPLISGQGFGFGSDAKSIVHFGSIAALSCSMGDLFMPLLTKLPVPGDAKMKLAILDVLGAASAGASLLLIGGDISGLNRTSLMPIAVIGASCLLGKLLSAEVAKLASEK